MLKYLHANTTNYNEKSKEELIQILSAKEKQITFLEEYISAQNLRQFANKSEKFNLNQLAFFDEVAAVKDEEKILSAEEEIQVTSFTRKKSPGRKSLPKDLPREQRIYNLTTAEKICHCGCEFDLPCDFQTKLD